MDSRAIYDEPTLVICEGSAESVIFELLLAEGKLIIPKDSLIEDPQTGRFIPAAVKIGKSRNGSFP
ncbi:hypothetical protein [Bifidobacterium kimbladii]|uniref:hypothetical protein n=1 Tax=Bifidobacterium kimbladii TaxID=1293826 RepID=UPI0005F963B7|nr:hypothetical protein [Bifidobacterium asteroides]